jgi:hypothetical protein
MSDSGKYWYHIVGLACVTLVLSAEFWAPALGLTGYVPLVIGILSFIFLIDLILYWRNVGRSGKQ